MGDSSADSSLSLTSTGTRVMKRSDSAPLLESKPKSKSGAYLWCCGQIHAKRLLLIIQVILFGMGCWGLVSASSPYKRISLPPLDGDFSLAQRSSPLITAMKSAPSTSAAHAQSLRDQSQLSRNMVSTLSYFLIFGVALTLTGLRLVERVWVDGRPVSRFCVLNPALFLLPGLLSQITLCIPIFYWTVMSIREEVIRSFFDESAPNFFLAAIDALRFTFVPCIVVWAVAVYLFLGSCIGVLYIWRRASNWKGRRQAAKTSLNWSFRDFYPNPSFLHQLNHAEALSKSQYSHRSRSLRSLRSVRGWQQALARDLEQQQINASASAASDEPCFQIEDETSAPKRPSLQNVFNNRSMLRSGVQVMPTVHEDPESPPRRMNVVHSETLKIEVSVSDEVAGMKKEAEKVGQ